MRPLPKPAFRPCPNGDCGSDLYASNQCLFRLDKCKSKTIYLRSNLANWSLALEQILR